MAGNDLFGWDLLYKTIEGNISSESDIIIALAHWFLIRNYAFRCLSVGDDKTLNENEEGTELLPDGWNESERTYSLRYIANDNLYILLGARTENVLVLNLLDVKSRNVSNVAIDPKDAIKSLKGNLKEIVPGISEMIERFKRELVEPVFTGNTKEVTTQTQNQEQASSERRATMPEPRLPDISIRTPVIPHSPLTFPSARDPLRDPLRDIGRGDLDPLGRGGGGMLFSPQSGIPFGLPPPGGRFPGVRYPLPEGARFDPFHPPDLDSHFGRPNPNPNHFRPPPDYDDIYM